MGKPAAGPTVQSLGYVGYEWVGFGRQNAVTVSTLEFKSHSSLRRIDAAVAELPLAYNGYEKLFFCKIQQDNKMQTFCGSAYICQ